MGNISPVSTTSSNSRVPKYIYLFLALVILVLAGEGGYYLYFKNTYSTLSGKKTGVQKQGVGRTDEPITSWKELEKIEIDYPSYIEFLIDNGLIGDEILKYSMFSVKGAVKELSEDKLFIDLDNEEVSMPLYYELSSLLLVTRGSTGYQARSSTLEEIELINNPIFIVGRNKEEKLILIAILKK